jgi:glycosyltransferase involved in cell wall biosynthesis
VNHDHNKSMMPRRPWQAFSKASTRGGPVNPLVSVVVPVYNGARYLPQCLDSLVSQTLPEIEIILVNDRSTDGSLGILYDYASRYPGRIVVIDSPVNRRQGGARNLGIRAARAEYIGFVDQDDWVEATMYQNMYAKAVATDSDLVRCFVEEFNEIPGEQGHRRIEISEPALSVEGRILSDRDRESLLMPGGIAGSFWSELFRRRVFLDNDLFFPEHLVYDDNYIDKLVLFYVERCAFVKEYLYHYRIHETSGSNMRNAPWLFDRLRVECMVLDDVASRGLNERLTEALDHLFMAMYFWNTIQFWERRSDGDFPVEVLREMRLEVLRRIPSFRSNKFYRQRFTWRARFLIDVAMVSPVAYTMVRKLFIPGDRVAGQLLRALRKRPAVYRGVRAIYRRLHVRV